MGNTLLVANTAGRRPAAGLPQDAAAARQMRLLSLCKPCSVGVVDFVRVLNNAGIISPERKQQLERMLEQTAARELQQELEQDSKQPRGEPNTCESRVPRVNLCVSAERREREHEGTSCRAACHARVRCSCGVQSRYRPCCPPFRRRVTDNVANTCLAGNSGAPCCPRRCGSQRQHHHHHHFHHQRRYEHRHQHQHPHRLEMAPLAGLAIPLDHCSPYLSDFELPDDLDCCAGHSDGLRGHLAHNLNVSSSDAERDDFDAPSAACYHSQS